MRALTIEPGVAASLRLEERAAPPSSADKLSIRMLAMGICGNDRELIGGTYGWAPPQRRRRLIIGHEMLGRVERAPAGSGCASGDLVVGIVRQPDPLPCVCCAAGEWDMCRNGGYTEHGIKDQNDYRVCGLTLCRRASKIMH